LVLLVTGKCGAGCYYCPLSRKKRGRAVTYADEMKVDKDSDILLEAELIRATGTGITGGDPLIQPEETARLIRLLKESFGSRHHVHLYTTRTDVASIESISRSGLDEIRFHPPMNIWRSIEGTEYAEAIKISEDLGIDVGIEIPSLPDKREEMLNLIDSAGRLGASFVNLNELEFSYTNYKALKKRGFDVKNDVSNAAKGSEKLAVGLLSHAPGGTSVHYCSASFKDSIQLRRRLMRRAKSITRPLDLLTKDGTIVMGIIETNRPEKILNEIRNSYQIPRRYIVVNEDMNRIEIASWILDEIADSLDLDSFIIEEYPTADRLEVEREKVSSRRH